MAIFGRRRIFLDYAGGDMNPSGIHREGRTAQRALEELRLKLSRLLVCQARDIVFTSGGTESDNLAILGVMESARQEIGKPHIIISSLEHPAVYESAKKLESQGSELTIIEPKDGVINAEDVLSKIKDNTVLVSIVYGASETGAVNPVQKIARLVKELRNKRGSKYPYIHTDASQAYEFLPVDIGRLPADLITLEKVLVIRPNVSISPIVYGGGQERGLRAGTQNLLGIKSFVEEFEASIKHQDKIYKKLDRLKKVFLAELEIHVPQAKVNTPKDSLPNIVSITFPGKLHEFLAIKLDEKGVAVSTGSACDSSKNEKDKEALRFSFNYKTSEREIKRAIRILRDVVV